MNLGGTQVLGQDSQEMGNDQWLESWKVAVHYVMAK